MEEKNPYHNEGKMVYAPVAYPAQLRGVIAPRPELPTLGSARFGQVIRPPVLTVAFADSPASPPLNSL